MVYQELDKDRHVMADSHKLKEVITNLLDNAIKYTMGQGEVEISHEIKGNYLVTHIKDTGIGVSQENAKKLFSKFYRVKTKETKDIVGTGLGLFICKEIIERMRGKIWARSQLGKGTTFSFSLPLA